MLTLQIPLIYPCGISESAWGRSCGFGKCSWCWTWIPKPCKGAELQPAIPGFAQDLKPAWSKQRCWKSGIYVPKISTMEDHFQELRVLKAFRIWATVFPICKLSHAYPFLLLKRCMHSTACALAVQQLEDSCISRLSSENEDIPYFPSYLAKIGLR